MTTGNRPIFPLSIVSSNPAPGTAPEAALRALLDAVDPAYLRQVVTRIAVPRHRLAEAESNAAAARWLVEEFTRLGLRARRQGTYDNVVATFGGRLEDARVLIGAHYDSVPCSPGADDNASAVAGMLGVAAALSRCGAAPVAFVAFNAEEDGMVGSADLVAAELKHSRLEAVHVLEMIGFASDAPGSQRTPQGLPVEIGERGDFIGIVANRGSNTLVPGIVQAAETCVPELPVKALQVHGGLETMFPHLLRSDHRAFWEAGLPALMWTDTAEFRNPNYHRPTDVPGTLNWGFLERVTRLLLAHTARHLALA